jgi:hypothetical protein
MNVMAYDNDVVVAGRRLEDVKEVFTSLVKQPSKTEFKGRGGGGGKKKNLGQGQESPKGISKRYVKQGW